MTGVEVVMAALAAGAAAGTGEAAKDAVVDAYTGLRSALKRKLDGKSEAEGIVDGVPVDAGNMQVDFVAALEQSGAADDPQILSVALRLLALVDPAESAAGKYRVNARDAKGVQIGDQNVQHNAFI